MTVLTFRDVSKFASVNPVNEFELLIVRLIHQLLQIRLLGNKTALEDSDVCQFVFFGIENEA